MGRPPLPDGTCVWELHGAIGSLAPWRNYLHLFLPAAGIPDASDLDQVNQDLTTFYLFFWGAVASHEVVLHLSRLTWHGSTGLVRSDSVQDVPAGGGQLDIASAAACFTWNVARAGRGRFGRTFLPGIEPSSYSNGGLLSDPPASAWQSEANDFLANVNAETTPAFPVCKLVIPHQREAGAWLPATELEPVVSVRLSPVVATQRRRLRHLARL